jgi:hypothetical protein
VSRLLELVREQRRLRLLPADNLAALSSEELLRSSEPLAAEEIMYRKDRKSFTEWCQLCGYQPAAHHRLLIAELEKVALGEALRLAIFMPPGSAKSTYTSVLFPPWFLMNSGGNILAASHTIELARRWGRRVRNLIVEHSPTLRIALADDSTAAERWSLQNGIEYYAAGVVTGIAGFRGKLGLIDDPVRSRKDADSETVRDKVWDWYINDFRPRLVPGAARILIQNRWHEDDLAGRALNHEEWKVICLPALAEPHDPLGRKVGEPLWDDDDYGYGEQLRELSTNTPARTWSAPYQQCPTPETGNFFKEEWLRPYTNAPNRQTLVTYGGSDFAVTADGGDYTCHIVIGIDPDDRPWLLDLCEAKRPQTYGSRAGATSSRSGSPMVGRSSKGRSNPASAHSSKSVQENARPGPQSRTFRRAVIRLLGRNRSADA